MSQWDSVRRTFERAHSDLFESTLYDAEFFSYTDGTYDSGEITGKTRESVGTANVELVPPATDTTIDIEGTDLSFSTSIRAPKDDLPLSDIDFPGDDVKTPSEIEIADTVDSSTETYQAHAYSEEKGSGMVMIRLEEL